MPFMKSYSYTQLSARALLCCSSSSRAKTTSAITVYISPEGFSFVFLANAYVLYWKSSAIPRSAISSSQQCSLSCYLNFSKPRPRLIHSETLPTPRNFPTSLPLSAFEYQQMPKPQLFTGLFNSNVPKGSTALSLSSIASGMQRDGIWYTLPAKNTS